MKHIKGFKEEDIHSAKLIGTRNMDQIPLDQLKIVVQFKTTEARDQVVKEGKERPQTSTCIREGKTPDELKKNRMFYLCAKTCQEKNEQLSGEDRKIWVYRPVLLPGSETMFVPKMRDLKVLEQKRKEYAERQARKQNKI